MLAGPLASCPISERRRQHMRCREVRHFAENSPLRRTSRCRRCNGRRRLTHRGMENRWLLSAPGVVRGFGRRLRGSLRMTLTSSHLVEGDPQVRRHFLLGLTAVELVHYGIAIDRGCVQQPSVGQEGDSRRKHQHGRQPEFSNHRFCFFLDLSRRRY